MWGSPYISIVPWMLVGASDRLLAVGAEEEATSAIEPEPAVEYAT